ncbi:DUF3093 domain-containing protein [Nocardioides houyundeii]|uniref:DUF3093 domain-containing protein n=1 Tax=Nocardioides houyundeii TaxID=2045452 RepID=UPI001F52EF91|nr:DUF3093 domain-containing protein [Nocardioides houyundeii]
MEYAERLHVPLRWWVQGTMMIASLWLALIVAIPGAAAWAITGAAALVLAAGFLAYGARVTVAGGELHAGRAHVPLEHVGTAEPLDADATRALAGVDADARAYLVLRPYLKRAVRIEITDPADPTPYWLVSSRRPAELAEALTRAAAAPRMSDPAAG